jgi:uncharacterized damage-inducible protein DinB
MSADMAAFARSALIGEPEQLHKEVRELTKSLTDEQLWTKPVEPGNSIGHLILHLTGNLNHYVGAQLGKSGYVRDREREFTESQPPSRKVLFGNLNAAVATVREIVHALRAEQLAAPHPEFRFGSVLSALVHLVAHFALHRGQMSYIARLVRQ